MSRANKIAKAGKQAVEDAETKIKRAKGIADAKFYQDEKELEQKKKRSEDQLELMTQFMLDPTSSATTLLEKRREMYELQEALQKDKEKFQEKEVQFKKTEEDLRNRDEEFHKQICEYYKNTFEKSLQDSNSNNNKILEETKASDEMKEKIDKLKEENKRLESNLEKLKEIQEKLKAYEEFLNRVKDNHSETFSDLNGVIETYKTLEDNYNNILKQTAEVKKRKEKEKEDFRLEKGKMEEEIGKKVNDINKIQADLKDLKEEKKRLENEAALMEANSNTIVSSLEMILLAVDNIYEKCNQQKNWTQHGDKEEFKELPGEGDKKNEYKRRVEFAKTKIKYIKNYMEDYKEITSNYESKRDIIKKSYKENK